MPAMTTTKFSIRRLLLGTVFVALPFATFGGFGLNGIVVSIFIAVPMFTASCIASREQLRSIFGIVTWTTFGLFIGGLFPSVGRQYDWEKQQIFCALCGCAAGLLRSEMFYAREASERASLTIAAQGTTDENGESPRK